MDRRAFVFTAGAAVLNGAPSDRLRLALVGLRGRGRDHIAGFGAMPNVEIATLCDVDESVLAQRITDVEKRTGKKPAGVVEFRKVLEDKSVEAVVIGTQNHWHTLQTIWACQAGKDVYVEKPCSHNPFESRQIIAAAKKYGRIVQHGTQTRSAAAVQEGMQKLREGIIGDVYMARGLCFNWRETIGRAKDEPVPKGVHYDLWTGPAPLRPFTKNRFHYNWHWQWAYGNGDIGNQGVHEMDVARWGLGVRYPSRVSAVGSHFMFDDDQETPNTMVATFEFDNPKRMLVFEVRHWMTNGEDGMGGAGKNTVGNIFFGSKGIMTREKMGYKTLLGREAQPGPASQSGETHFANFVNAVRARNAALLNGGIEEGAISCDLIHLANISYRLDRSLRFDAGKMQCAGDEEANRMFTRRYRAPYIVPEKV